jgi:L-fucose isomerase-like protein
MVLQQPPGRVPGFESELNLTAPRIGFVTCVHPIYNLPYVTKHRDNAISALQSAGCVVISPEIARNPEDISKIVEELKAGEIDLLLFFFCTWIAEEITLSIAREMGSIPLLLWALPYLDLSVPMPSPMTGITATGCNLRRAGIPFIYRIGAVNPEGIQAVTKTAHNAAAVTKLRQARFGILGAPCPGMIDTRFDYSLLQNCLGLTTIRLDIEDLLRAREASSEQEALQLAQQLIQRATRSEVSVETVADQCRLLLATKSLIAKHKLDGVSVRCWPELRDQHKATICLAVSEMAEAGVPTVCEADLTALVTSFILTSLTRQPNCTLEITAYLEEQNALQLAHCGCAAISLAGEGGAIIRGHMRTGVGATIESILKPGSITIAKLLRPFEKGLQMFIARGEVIPAGSAYRGTVATVRTESSPEHFLQIMLHHAVEHHLVITYGDCTEDLREFCQFAGIECIIPGT